MPEEKRHLRIILASGGSGGHLFPAIRVAQELVKDGHHCLFVGSFGVGSEKITQNGFHFINLNAQGLVTKNIFGLIEIFFLNLKAFIRSIVELIRFKPDVVAGFGGYGAFAVIAAAVLLRFPTIIHEQNVFPGKANRWLFPWVKKIAISFIETKKYFDSLKVVVTGCPSHIFIKSYDRLKVLNEFGLKENIFTILIFGGSQGSHKINQSFLAVVEGLSRSIELQVIHVAGKKDLSSIRDSYEKFLFPFFVVDFLEQMGKAYFVSDLIISRAGAGSVTEIAMFEKKSILIPYPYAQGHQLENAQVLARRELAAIIEEKDLTQEKLRQVILNYYQDRTKIVASRFKEVFIEDSHLRLKQEILNCCF